MKASIPVAWLLAAGLIWAGPAAAQMHHHSAGSDSTRQDMPGTTHEMPGMRHEHTTSGTHPDHDMSSMSGHDMASMGHEHAMTGLYGPYPMAREASGTSWQPDRAGHRGVHAMRGSWTLMLHGMADLVADRQGGPRGDDKVFSSNMLMGMARRAAGPGVLGLRAMVSAEPATIGKEGYPLLLQTGETADGRTPLIDRQHPHDLFMELAASYSVARGNRSLFLYGGLPGEPALGPPAYMHRFSGMTNPMAPITHHWLDSSHITFGVATAGAVWGAAKLEASAFHGREPDQNRWDIESPKLDSHAVRLSVNPTPALALQVSRGRLHSPEQLEPEVDVDRTTASLMVAGESARARWEATAAWGRNDGRPGPALDAFLAEAAVQLRGRHTLFTRAERVEKNELFVDSGLQSNVYRVGEVTAGYRFDFWIHGHLAAGLGAAGTISFAPDLGSAGVDVSPAPTFYDRTEASGIVFTHLEIR